MCHEDLSISDFELNEADIHHFAGQCNYCGELIPHFRRRKQGNFGERFATRVIQHIRGCEKYKAYVENQRESLGNLLQIEY